MNNDATRRQVLDVQDLTAGYGERDVLRQASLTLHEGEILGVVGPNGSGKSTLLRAITNVLRPRAGTVHLLGANVDEYGSRDLARVVSVVPQAALLPDGFTALEVALMGRTPYLRLLQSEGPQDVTIARRSLLQTDALHLSDRYIDELSGGERQRVIVARALTQQSPILLMDEPTAHLDIGHQVALLDLVTSLTSEQNLSVVAVVHDLSLAAQYCHRLLLLSEGSIVSAGDPGDVLRPATIKDVYGVDVHVIPHPSTGRPTVVPIPGTGANLPNRKSSS